MPAADLDLESPEESGYTELPFPPLKRAHILHCSVHYWYPKYRAHTPKARLVPLSTACVNYLRADGIVLPSEDNDSSEAVEWSADASTSRLGTSDEVDDDSTSEEENDDPSTTFPETHAAIWTAIAELGGKAAPKLNWSAPKDATWINPTNSMACTSANDVYVMLKSSDFVTHDLEHWDDDCVEDLPPSPDLDTHEGDTQGGEHGDAAEDHTEDQPPYHLLLRKWIQIAPSVEFRCFVRNKRLIGICQRDPNFYDFLFDMVPSLHQLVQDFFDEKLAPTFPDDNFAFDVYIPSPYKRVWLIDINPWHKRTDPLLFSWLELLTMDVPDAIGTRDAEAEAEPPNNCQDREDASEIVPEGVVRLPFRPRSNGSTRSFVHFADTFDPDHVTTQTVGSFEMPESADEELFTPEFRLIKRDDPEAYSFNSPQYSAHKLPADVVEASQSGPGPLREFAEQWREVLEQEKEQEEMRTRDRSRGR